MHTISSLCYSAAKGETVLLFHSEDIQECFYDLFNQRFTALSNADEKMYFSTVAVGAHLKLCEVSPKFQCLVVVKERHLQSTHPAFLNRFEKYSMSYSSLLKDILLCLPIKLKNAILCAKTEVKPALCIVHLIFITYLGDNFC